MEELGSQLNAERRIEVIHDDEVILFCRNQSLIKYLDLAEDLIKRHFATVQKIVFSMGYDPEIPDKWVNADIKVIGEIDQVIEWENSFVNEWVNSVPYPEREKIRLSCDII